MYSPSLTISCFLALCTIATSSLYEESFTTLRSRAASYILDHGLNDYLSAREAIPLKDTDLGSWSHATDLLKRHARPHPQSNADFEFGDTGLYVRTVRKGSKQGKGGKGNSGSPKNQNKASGNAGTAAGAGNDKNSPHSAAQGEPSSTSKPPKSAARSTSPDSIPSKNQLLEMVKQNYNWPPAGYKHMSKTERKAAGAKILQEHRRKLDKLVSLPETPSSGASVRDIVSKFEKSLPGQPGSSSAPVDKATPKNEAEITPVSKFAQGPASSVSSWASLSRQSSLSRASTPGPEALSRQDSGKSGVHVEKPSALSREPSDPGDGWTVL